MTDPTPRAAARALHVDPRGPITECLHAAALDPVAATPYLVAAVEGVKQLHYPIRTGGACAECADSAHPWPCRTVRVIAAVFGIEVSS